VGKAFAFELVVKIGVGVDVKDGQLRPPPSDRPKNGVGNRVISAEGERTPTVRKQAGYPGFDPVSRGGIRRREVAGVAQISDIRSELSRRVPMGRVKLRPDQRRRLGGPPKE
jgi:hypothetical protein